MGDLPSFRARLPLTIPESLSQRLRSVPWGTVAAISLPLLLTLIYFWPFFFRGEIVVPADLLPRYAPWSFLAGEGFGTKQILRSDIIDGYLPSLNQYKVAIWQGDFPLWSPLWSQGRPFASQLTSSFLHPLNAIILVLPLSRGFSLVVMAKFFLSGFFMYLFLRRIGVGRVGSSLGGVAYMFSGFNIVWLMWPHTLVSSFAPLLFLQTENLLRKPTPLNTAVLSLVVAVMILGGFPAVAGYFFYAVGLYFVLRLVERMRRDRLGWGGLGVVAAFGLSFALAAGLVAFQALPSLEAADFLDIARERSGRSLASIPIRQSLQLVVPNFFGNHVYGFGLRGWGNYNETAGYVGIITLVAAFFGFLVGVRRGRTPAVYFGVLALLSFLIIYRDTGPLRSLVSHLPVFDLNPNTRMLSVLGFALAGGAAYGFDELLRMRLIGWWRRVIPLALVGLAVFLAGVVALLARQMTGKRALLSDFLGEFPSMELGVLGQLDFESFRLAWSAFGILLVMLFVVLLALHFWRVLPTAVVAAGILALVATDLFGFAFRQNPAVADRYFYPETPAIHFLEANLRPYERMAPFDGTFMIPGTQAFYGLNSAFSHTFYSQRHRELLQAFSENAFASSTAVVPLSSTTQFDSPIIDLLGIKYLTFKPGFDFSEVDPSAATKYELVYANPGELVIYENKDSTPAFLVGDVKLAEPSQIIEELQSTDFDPGSLAYIEDPLPSDWLASESTAGDLDGSVAVNQYESGSVTYDVETGSQALLVTPELFYPGWRVYVDGERAEIYRANYLFRAVFVGAGRHEVEFIYRPSSFRVGAIISVLALGLVGVMLSADLGRRLWRSRESKPSRTGLGGGV